MKKVSVLLSVFCLLLAAGAVSAQTGARSFAGTWEINIAKSKLPERTRIEALTMNVSQTDDALTIETVVKRGAPDSMAQVDASGGMRPDGNRAARRGGAGGSVAGGGIANFPASVTYNLAGNPVTVESESAAGMPSSAVTLNANFEKDGRLKLVQDNKITGAGGEFTVKTVDTWELSADGKVLKIARELTTPRGAQTAEMFFVKANLDGFSADAMPSGISNATTSSANMSEVNGDAKTNANPARDKSMKGVVVAPKQISGGVLNAKALQLPQPVFPPAARAVRASGAVNVEVTVDEAGNVVSANAVSGHPLLRAAAADAARAAKFAPVLVDGIPAKVVGVLVFKFVP